MEFFAYDNVQICILKLCISNASYFSFNDKKMRKAKKAIVINNIFIQSRFCIFDHQKAAAEQINRTKSEMKQWRE